MNSTAILACVLALMIGVGITSMFYEFKRPYDCTRLAVDKGVDIINMIKRK